MKRAQRRYQKQRAKQKARRLVRQIWGYQGQMREDVEKVMVENCDNLKICNKPCCQNPRRSGWYPAGGKTRKELE